MADKATVEGKMAWTRNPEVSKAHAFRALEAAQRLADTVKGTHDVANRISEVEVHRGYAEPGYQAGPTGLVAVGNWNDLGHGRREPTKHDNLPSRLRAVFETLGIDCEWSDEWSPCDDCCRLIRTSPDSYGWKLSGAETDGSLVCADCLDPTEHLEGLEGHSDRANTIGTIDPGEYGYVKLEEHETGLHPGQTGSPRKVADALRAKGVSRFLFQVDDSRQFDISWSAWVHESERELVSSEAPAAAGRRVNHPRTANV